ASLLSATVEGDASVVVTGVAAIGNAGPGDLTFCAHEKYASLLPETRAAAVLVPLDYSGPCPAALLRVKDPYHALLSVLRTLTNGLPERQRDVHPTALVDASARLGQNVAIGAYCVIEAEAEVEDDATLGAGVYVGAKSVIGEGTYVFPNVTVLHGVRLGRRVIVHSGAVLGSDGFGYLQREGIHEKVPQLGSVVVGDDTEIGANVAIDRGTLGETRIGKGVKIDNLVHIGHNVTVGDGTLLIAQVGISGSTEIGSGVTIAGQAGLAGHIRIGDGAVIGAQAGVTKPVPAGERVSGYPAMEHERARRLNAYYRRLPGLYEQLQALENRVRELEAERVASSKRKRERERERVQ
ncbi:MAG TPA: UDP-3-O-(3-hydroxymyristoyl)glucosamine N-acyltransferase, partial [Candidatus Eisenbacteria bacterium]|nr:UDP-3-O-(3-hydroxymyristoyl)glucosamine N-acyltransferase [Candidatus Eisenbacteria bacterium]